MKRKVDSKGMGPDKIPRHDDDKEKDKDEMHGVEMQKDVEDVNPALANGGQMMNVSHNQGAWPSPASLFVPQHIAQGGLLAGLLTVLPPAPPALDSSHSALASWPLTVNIDRALNGLNIEQLKQEVRFQRARELQLVTHLNRMALMFQTIEDAMALFKRDMADIGRSTVTSMPMEKKEAAKESNEILEVELIQGNCLPWQQFASEVVTIPRFVVRSVDGRVVKFRFLPDSAISLAGLDRAGLSDFHNSFKSKIKNYLSRSAQAEFDVYKESYLNMRNSCDAQTRNYVPFCDVKKGIRLVSDIQLLVLIKLVRTESRDDSNSVDELSWITSVPPITHSSKE
eukprot:GILJ01001085.1.p1 GENE.GILJ01001085.1~~GILJ01001085.1.p1  ORF type:complete len:354 (+),score=50.30 GILJ01001085.1:43-1062(+)